MENVEQETLQPWCNVYILKNLDSHASSPLIFGWCFYTMIKHCFSYYTTRYVVQDCLPLRTEIQFTPTHRIFLDCTCTIGEEHGIRSFSMVLVTYVCLNIFSSCTSHLTTNLPEKFISINSTSIETGVVSVLVYLGLTAI